MLVNTFNPFDNLLLSSLIAAIPIVLFLLCLTVFKMKGIYAAITTLVVTLLIAIPFFKLPVGIASGAVVEGFFQGIIPIGYIVMMAVLLYKITVESGQFLTIQDSITNISQDQRIQVLLYWICIQRIFRRCSRIWCTNCNLCTFINTIRI